MLWVASFPGSPRLRGRGHHDLHVAWSITSLLLNFYRNVSVTLKASSDTTKLPDPCGPLPTTVPSSSIESANAEVKQVIETEESSDRRKRGHCEKFSPERRFQIGKYAAKNGVAETMRFYAKKFVLKESSIERRRTPTPYVTDCEVILLWQKVTK